MASQKVNFNKIISIAYMNRAFLKINMKKGRHPHMIWQTNCKQRADYLDIFIPYIKS